MAKAKKVLTEREQLIVGFTKRVKHKNQQLAKTRKFHRDVEAGLVRKIKLDEMQLKALKRSKLWHEDYRVEKGSFPSLGRMIVEQTKPAHVTVEQADAVVEEGYLTKLY